MRLSVRGVESQEISQLLDFMVEMYGANSYQAQERYINWLYLFNPVSQGVTDCLIVHNDDAIVGCIHRMRLPYIMNGQQTTMVSLQNHVISPQLRSGAGIVLMQKCIQDGPAAFLPGVHGRLGEAYRRLGYHEIDSYWFAYILNPVGALSQTLSYKFLKHNSNPILITSSQLERLNQDGLIVTMAPDVEQLTRLIDHIETQSLQNGRNYVPWTIELIRWRYFSPDGPRHVYLESPDHSTRAVLSLGKRNGVQVVRLVEYDAGVDTRFMKKVLRIARKIGGMVALAYTTRKALKEQLICSGWKLRKDPPSSFSYGSPQMSISVAATDVGFEAFLTKVVS